MMVDLPTTSSGGSVDGSISALGAEHETDLDNNGKASVVLFDLVGTVEGSGNWDSFSEEKTEDEQNVITGNS